MTKLYLKTCNYCLKKNQFHFTCSPVSLEQNIFAMDLRSANKISEKPPPRLRLSLTRSMSTDVDHGERGSVYHRQVRRKAKQRVSKRRPDGTSNKIIRPVRKKEEEEVMEEDWEGISEEEKQESECTTEDRCEGSLYGQLDELNSAVQSVYPQLPYFDPTPLEGQARGILFGGIFVCFSGPISINIFWKGTRCSIIDPITFWQM